jgi:hypothetical protein
MNRRLHPTRRLIGVGCVLLILGVWLSLYTMQRPRRASASKLVSQRHHLHGPSVARMPSQ